MKELSRTLIFLVVAGVSVLGAAAAHYASRPKLIEGFDEVNKEFYPEFTDPTAPKGIKVVAYSEDTAHIKEFEVALKDGKWRIPSHYDYPADGKDRLARTAASVIGIKREALASRRESDQEKFNVLDPHNEDGAKLKGRGQRVVLTGADGKPLADYIIGKKVEGQEGYYYVRSPKEKSTYKAKLDINLSTKFGDWIEADLLQLDTDKLVEVTINKYSIDRTKLRFIDPEKSVLTRMNSSDPWKLAGLDEATEELKTDEVRTLVNNLDDLKIVGVRPKPQGLRPDLSFDPKIARNPIARSALMNSLVDKGFLIAEDENGNPVLVSNEGGIDAATNEGVEYVLYFGDVFTGSDLEVEIGFAKDDSGKNSAGEAKPEKKEGEAKADGEKADEKKDGDAAGENKDDAAESKDDAKPADGKEKKGDLKKSRYLMVMARFDEQRLGPTPVKPEKPEDPAAATAEEKKPDEAKPEGNKPDEKKDPEKKDEEKKPEEKASDPEKKSESSGDEDEEDAEEQNPAAESKPEEKKADDKKSDDAKPEEKKDEEKKADEKKPEDKPATDSKAEYEAALEKWKRDVEKYENDLKLHNDKVDAGRKKADALNKRFAQWYYVISAESFDSLRLSRAALVKVKDKPAEEKKDDEKPADARPESKPEEK